jgi:hypothetical protein
MLNPRNPTSAIGLVRENLQQTGQFASEDQLRPGDTVVVLDIFGGPTGIQCTVQTADMHSVGVIWGGDTIMVGRSWLRKVS